MGWFTWPDNTAELRAAERRARDAERRMQATERRLQRVRARYDAAQTDSENRKHWMMADGLSARAANSLAVRSVLRNRSRYETSSNSYAAGMLLTLANDMVGTGPRLQLHLADRRAANQLEAEFQAWAKAIRLPQKLRTMRCARARDGEAFALLVTNPSLPTPVQLDLRTIEADQITTPFLDTGDPHAVDGIRFDEWSNPTMYDLLPYHPGDQIAMPNWTPIPHPAHQVIHWFRPDRPGQVRGVPEIMPALPLFAMLRRYTLATIAAAETAADFTAILEATGGANGDDGDAPAAADWEEIEIVRRTMLTTPAGYKLSQFKPEQPVTSYDMFKRSIIEEIARCLNMPFNVAAGNSAGYNYSSGRLDHQIYFRSVGIDQSDCEVEILDRLFRCWLEEAQYIPRYLPVGLGPLYRVPHTWSWDPAEDLDPVKSAQARLTNLQSGMTSYQAEYARLGLDWEVEQQRQAEALGMTVENYRALLRQSLLGNSATLALQQKDQAVVGRLRRRVNRLRRALGQWTGRSAV